MPSLAAVREARILALEAELSALRGDTRPAFRYDHSTPLKDPYAHTGVRPWGGWRSGWKSPTRPRVRFGISWSVRENIEPAAVERSGRCEPFGRHASRGVGETMSEPTHEAPAPCRRFMRQAGDRFSHSSLRPEGDAQKNGCRISRI